MGVCVVKMVRLQRKSTKFSVVWRRTLVVLAVSHGRRRVCLLCERASKGCVCCATQQDTSCVCCATQQPQAASAVPHSRCNLRLLCHRAEQSVPVACVVSHGNTQPTSPMFRSNHPHVCSPTHQKQVISSVSHRTDAACVSCATRQQNQFNVIIKCR